jgi:hypothetical protein
LALIPTFLACLAAFLSYRRPFFKHRLARRVSDRLTSRRLLGTHATRAGYCKNQQNK